MGDRPRPEGRAAYVIAQLYYYVGAAIGAGFLIGGTIALLMGLRRVVLPDEFETAREGVRGVLHGLAFAVPGLALAWTHLREARRREGGTSPPTFWGRSLYFHLIALIALGFVLGGTIAALHSGVDAAYQTCEEFIDGGPVAIDCYPPRGEALRDSIDALIFIVAAGPVYWWHLRQGRRATTPA